MLRVLLSLDYYANDSVTALLKSNVAKMCKEKLVVRIIISSEIEVSLCIVKYLKNKTTCGSETSSNCQWRDGV